MGQNSIHHTYMTRYAIRNALTRHAIRKRVHNLYFEGGVCGWSQWNRGQSEPRRDSGVNRILLAPNLAHESEKLRTTNM